MVGYNQESEKYETLNAYRKDFAFDLRYSMPEGQPTGVTVEVKKSGLFSPCSDVLTTILKSVICLKPI